MATPKLIRIGNKVINLDNVLYFQVNQMAVNVVYFAGGPDQLITDELLGEEAEQMKLWLKHEALDLRKFKEMSDAITPFRRGSSDEDVW